VDSECRGRSSEVYVALVWTLKVQGYRGWGRPKKTWEQCVKCDIRMYGMRRV